MEQIIMAILEGFMSPARRVGHSTFTQEFPLSICQLVAGPGGYWEILISV